MKEIQKQDARLAKLLSPVKPQSGKTYIPSQFVLSFEHDGENYLFNFLTKQLVTGKLPEAVLAGAGYDEYIASMFLVPSDKDECAYYNSVFNLMHAFYKKKDFAGYVILPTTGCNARCIYCYEEGMKPVKMTPEVIDRTIQFIKETHSKDTIDISWFGGEPLLCPDIIDKISAGIREAGLKLKSTMTSNGSLVTPEIIRKMKEDWNLRHIQISMDGLEEDYISRKRYYRYTDTYRKVMESVSLMSEAGINVSIRCNVDEENIDSIPEFMKELAEGISDKTNVNVYFAILYGMLGSPGYPVLRKKNVSYVPLVGEYGFRTGTGLSRDNKELRVNHCMADGGGIVIDPEGNLILCEHCPPEGRVGDIWHGITDEKARKEFCRKDIVREKCRKCPLLPVCTTFIHCPIQNESCTETGVYTEIALLKRYLDKLKSEGIGDTLKEDSESSGECAEDSVIEASDC